MSNDDWYRFYAPRRLAGMTEARMAADRAAAEIDINSLLARLKLNVADHILEIGCGWGRHSVALAQRGFTNVLSIDIAPEPLALARRLAGESGVTCEIRQQSFCEVTERGFDAILSLYDRSCCGFPTEQEDRASLCHLASMLNPGGWLLFGINDWPFQLPEPSRHWEQTEEGLELVEIIPDRAAMTCMHRVTLLRGDGRREVYTLTRRHYYLPELRRLLCETGFELITALHRLVEDRPYGDGSDGLFVYARRRLCTTAWVVLGTPPSWRHSRCQHRCWRSQDCLLHCLSRKQDIQSGLARAQWAPDSPYSVSSPLMRMKQ